MPLGHLIYRSTKMQREHRISGTLNTLSGAESRTVQQDPCDMVKAELLELQSSAVKSTPVDKRQCTTQLSQNRYSHQRLESSLGWRWVMNPFKGMSGAPTSHYRSFCWEQRIAYGARALWRRSLHSSLRTGKPSTWRREAGSPDARSWRYA
jgi:hypothetical protein